MSSQGNKNLLRQLGQALNDGDLDAVEGIFAPDYVRHDPTGLLHEVGVREYKQAFSAFRRAFPDAHWTLEEALEDGDRVVGRWTFHGTHDGPFFNLAPTGRKVTYPIIGIYRVENGRIAEDWHVYHALGLWQTLIPEVAELIADAQA
jgi:steroid delta-isomerase-like uncharacterized protein